MQRGGQASSNALRGGEKERQPDEGSERNKSRDPDRQREREMEMHTDRPEREKLEREVKSSEWPKILMDLNQIRESLLWHSWEAWGVFQESG